LSVFAKLGCVDILGVDGNYVDRRSLQIPKEQLRAANLSRALALSRTFDLATSLEVAEHLPPESAEGFIAGITKLAPVVLFSAAIPHQGGTDHVNERWPQYWADLFKRHGFDAIDCIRSEIWDNEEVEWWYAQNTILYANEAGLKAHPNLSQFNSSVGLSVVHPRTVRSSRGGSASASGASEIAFTHRCGNEARAFETNRAVAGHRSLKIGSPRARAGTPAARPWRRPRSIGRYPKPLHVRGPI
jgi:hypothetical protein